MSESQQQSAGSYVVRVKQVILQRVVVGCMPASETDWAAALETLFQDVWKFLNTFEDVRVGPAMARLIPLDSGGVIVEAGFPVAEPLNDVAPFSIAVLPAGEAATLLLQGPYERLLEATSTLENWLGSEKRRAAADCRAPWLIFWATPDDVNLPSELRTELVWPLENCNPPSN